MYLIYTWGGVCIKSILCTRVLKCRWNLELWDLDFQVQVHFIFMLEENNSAWEDWIHHLVESDIDQLQSQMMETSPASPED